jgi:putative ABC transport system ATP-binding protein
MLELVGLKERLTHLPDELSGGEQQRVAIARALANHPKIILADEPTGDLDTKTGTEVVQIMYETAKKENASVLVVTHDPVVADRAEKLFEMRDGIITKALPHPPREPYRLRAIEPVPPEPARSLSQPN